jgi:hypothetical protein
MIRYPSNREEKERKVGRHPFSRKEGYDLPLPDPSGD